MRPLRLHLEHLLKLCAVVLALAVPLLSTALAGDDYDDKRIKIAAVISMGLYQHANTLRNPPNDATLVAAKLEAAGFDVAKIADAGLASFTPAVEAFIAKAKGADIALVYYAGHAVQIDGENYMVPVDFNAKTPDILGALYPVKTLLEGLNRNAKARVLLLDACRNNPFQAQLKDLLGARASGQGLAAIQMPVIDGRTLPVGTNGLVVGYATQPQYVALDGKGANSPYATALTAALVSPDDDFNSVLVRTTRAVLTETKGRQQPEHRMALTGPLYLVSRQKPLQCDVLAAEPDNDVLVAGVNYEEIDFVAALPACEADLANHPGSPRLMHNLGKALERSSRPAEAVAMYRKSAELGYDWGQYFLANCYLEGTGIAQDIKEGAFWLRKAYEQGHRDASTFYTEVDFPRLFDDKPSRVRTLQRALRDAGHITVPDTGTMDDATREALSNFISSQGIENKAVTFQVLDRLGILEALFPKKETGKTE